LYITSLKIKKKKKKKERKKKIFVYMQKLKWNDAFYDLDFLGQVHYQLTWTDIQIQCFNIKNFLFYLLRREQTLCLLGVLLWMKKPIFREKSSKFCFKDCMDAEKYNAELV
jgi:hypothetical protein